MNKLTFDKQTKVYNIISKYFRNHHKIGGRHTAIVVYGFIYNCMTEKQANSIIGLENFKTKYPKLMTNNDVVSILIHDIIGLINRDKMFLPKFDSYKEYYIN